MNKPHLNEFIGKPIEYAEKYVKTVRVAKENDKAYPLTADFRPERLNVELLGGLISKAYWG